MTDLIAELAEVVRLGAMASDDEPWQVDANGDVVCNGEQVAWPVTNKLDAPYIAALSNFIRAHAAEIEADKRDAERYRKIRIGRSVWDGDVYAMTFAAGGDYPVRGDELDAFADAMRSAKEDGNEG